MDPNVNPTGAVHGAPPPYSVDPPKGMPAEPVPRVHTEYQRPPYPVTIAPAHAVRMINSQVVISPVTIVGSKPSHIVCPVCRMEVITRVEKHSTGLTHGTAAFLCFFFCIISAFLPYVMGCFMEYQHYCPNCNSFIGRYTK